MKKTEGRKLRRRAGAARRDYDVDIMNCSASPALKPGGGLHEVELANGASRG